MGKWNTFYQCVPSTTDTVFFGCCFFSKTTSLKWNLDSVMFQWMNDHEPRTLWVTIMHIKTLRNPRSFPSRKILSMTSRIKHFKTKWILFRKKKCILVTALAGYAFFSARIATFITRMKHQRENFVFYINIFLSANW